MKKYFFFERIDFSCSNDSILLVDRENRTIIFFGNKAEYIKSAISRIKGSTLAKEAYLDLLEIFNLYQEVTEQELLEQGYTLVYSKDKNGIYNIEASFSNEASSISRTVLRTYKI